MIARRLVFLLALVPVVAVAELPKSRPPVPTPTTLPKPPAPPPETSEGSRDALFAAFEHCLSTREDGCVTSLFDACRATCPAAQDCAATCGDWAVEVATLNGGALPDRCNEPVELNDLLFGAPAVPEDKPPVPKESYAALFDDIVFPADRKPAAVEAPATSPSAGRALRLLHYYRNHRARALACPPEAKPAK